MKSKLPRRVHEILETCPKAGNGVHRWLYRAALKLHEYFPDKQELARMLTEATSGCGRSLQTNEVEDAIQSSLRDLESDGEAPAKRRPRPIRNEHLIRTIIGEGPKLEDLRAASPIRWDDENPHTEEIIDKLFPGNPLLCAGLKNTRSLTRTREEWRNFLEKQQLIVPQPMSAIYGATKAGKQSMRTLNNIGPRRFVVVEFDKGSFDEHAALLAHLGKFAVLVMVVHSGNKSLHGWFYFAGLPEEKAEEFFAYAIRLGADPATWTRNQFVRMPDGQRDSGRRQKVVFFNPQPLEVT